MEELSKQYNPKEAEDKWYKFWEEKNLLRGFGGGKPNPGVPLSVS